MVTRMLFYSRQKPFPTQGATEEGIPLPIIMYHNVRNEEGNKELGDYVITDPAVGKRTLLFSRKKGIMQS